MPELQYWQYVTLQANAKFFKNTSLIQANLCSSATKFAHVAKIAYLDTSRRREKSPGDERPAFQGWNRGQGGRGHWKGDGEGTRGLQTYL